MKRQLVFMIALLICAVFFACTQQEIQHGAQQDSEAVFSFYFTDDKDGIILESYLGQEISLAIPSMIQNLPVAKIGRQAFYGIGRENRLVNVSIPDSVIVIERNAFSHNHLEDVIIGSNVAFIGREAFLQNRLVSINIPYSVSVIDSMSFMQNRLAAVNIPGSVVIIGSGAFMLNHLTEAVISEGVVYIGRLAFALNQLTSVTIPDSVTRIWPFAFENNPLTRISIGAYVELGEFNLAGQYFPSFDLGFDEFYLAQGRRAGTYTWNNGGWSVELR